MPTESGFSNQKKIGSSQYKTIQYVGSDKFGVNTAQMYLYDVTPAAIAITGVEVDEINPQKIYLEIVAHDSRVGDIVRLLGNANLTGWEFDIVEVLDADTVAIYNIGHKNSVSALPEVGDLAKTCRWITAKADPEGALQTSSGPVQYLEDGITTTVSEDTDTPANTNSLPVGLFIRKEGINYPVNDSVTPANVVAVPVKIMAVDGTNINITAGDINIQTTDMGANFDSMRIGDGSGNYIGVTADDEAQVHDSKNLVTLDAINAKTPALVAGKVPVDTGLVQALTDTQLRATPVPVSGPLTDSQLRASVVPVTVSNFPATQPISAVSLPLPTGASTEAKQDAGNSLLTTISTKDFSTAAKQDAQTALLTTISAKLGDLSQATDETAIVNDVTTKIFSKPPTAVSMMIFNNASATNANRIRIAIGGPVSWSTPSGAILGVGASTGQIPARAVAAIAENADSAADVTVLWF